MLEGVTTGSANLADGDSPSLRVGRPVRPGSALLESGPTRPRRLQALRALSRWAPNAGWRYALSPARAQTVITTILFTDLIDVSTQWQLAEAEDMQAAFAIHRRLLSEAVRPRGGREVQWLGSGLMVAFSSVSDALQSAIALQQATRWPVDGMRLAVRVGLDVGETLRENRDHFGTTVVVARRLCDRAESGQILCSGLVAELLGRGRSFRFQPRGTVRIDGIATPVDALEVLYGEARGRPSRHKGATAPGATRWLDSSESRAPGAGAREDAGGGRGVTARLTARLVGCLRWIGMRFF
jgi:class 3 adenylate cyclase